MKLLALAMTIALSTSAFASIPATEAIKNVLPAGTYAGKTGSQKCVVTVESKDDFASVSIKTETSSEGFGLLNSSNGIVINDSTGEVSATQSMNAPFYLKGGTKFLNINPRDLGVVEVSISKILLDHKGNDVSTYLECIISL